MNIVIIKRDSGQIVAECSINLGGLNYTPSEDEYFDLAWREATEDEVVDESKRSEYEFRKAK